MPRAPLLSGLLFALAAGLMWGLVFVGPLLLPEYPATLQSFGRYLAFGLIALPLGWFDRTKLRQLTRADWLEALKLALVGNIVYYLFLASAIQRAGGPLPTMIIGTLPVVIAVTSKLRRARAGARVEAPLSWSRLVPSLLLIGLGIALVNHVELVRLRADPAADGARYALGALMAVAAVGCWTWYPIRNAEWLRAHPERSARGWATAQGLMTLPLALTGYAATWLWSQFADGGLATPGMPPFTMPFGPRPLDFLLLMFAIGLFASWLGTLCWNEASQRLPPALSSQLIVFETLAALGYALLLRRSVPPIETLLGIALLVAGVVWAVRSQASIAEPARPHGPA
jgi:drug/metabolite transporter (DMT)-like permease